MKPTNQTEFDQVVKQLKNEFNSTKFDGCTEDENIKIIPSGSINLDKALGIDGYPQGKIIEIYGNESSGKTTLALQAISQAQKINLNCAYLDLENSLDHKYCQINGINTSKMIIAQPESAEQTFNLIEALIKTEMIDVIVVDSVAAMIPEVELNGDMNDQTIGIHARIMSKGLRTIQALLIKHRVTIIFINQIREKIGIMFGNNETTTGGRALRFYASIRIEVKRTELLKKDENIIGMKICTKIVKNKLAAPMTKAHIDIFFNQGIDSVNELINFAIQKQIINKKGA
jgi:recombination protein RecA